MEASYTGRDHSVSSLVASADGLLRRPWVAYASLALLQLSAMWGVWDRHDLTPGDTASYFRYACLWQESSIVDMTWSPLYTSFYGSLLRVVHDAYEATVLHRLIIVFAAAMMLLAVLRRLLPASVAWLMAAWWAVLPINFNAMYEVHLFAVLPVLACWWLLAICDGPWNRGAALALLAGATILVRNELSVGASLFAGVCLWKEWRSLQAACAGARVRMALKTLTAYAVTLAAGCSVVLLYYEHSGSRFGAGHASLRAQARQKHELNMGQGFAFGYRERHPEWQRNCWTEYQDLTKRYFGKQEVSFGDMLRTNPRAEFEHIAWNLRLLPNGVQVILFNATSGKISPDYVGVPLGSAGARFCTVAMFVVWATGTATLLGGGVAGLRAWLQGRETAWLAMLCVGAVAIPVSAAMRPRPSFILPLGIPLMAFTGLCLAAILRRFTAAGRVVRVLPLVVLAAYPFAPVGPYANGDRPLLDTCRLLQPYEPWIARRDTRFLKGRFAFEVMSYLGRGKGTSFDYGLLAERPVGVPLDTFLESRGINLVFLDEELLKQLDAAPGDSAAANVLPQWTKWNLLGCGNVPGDRWRLYRLNRPES